MLKKTNLSPREIVEWEVSLKVRFLLPVFMTACVFNQVFLCQKGHEFYCFVFEWLRLSHWYFKQVTFKWNVTDEDDIPVCWKFWQNILMSFDSMKFFGLIIFSFFISFLISIKTLLLLNVDWDIKVINISNRVSSQFCLHY